jgi:putative transposase
VTATFQLLFIFLVLSHERRRIVHFAVTAHPTAEWTSQQLVDAFPWETAPRYLLRDRDGSYGAVTQTARAMGIQEVLTAPRSPLPKSSPDGVFDRDRIQRFRIVVGNGIRK